MRRPGRGDRQQHVAKRFWGARRRRSASGPASASGEWRTVIGVAADLKDTRRSTNRRGRTSTCRSCRPTARAWFCTPEDRARRRAVEQARAHVAALDADLPILSARPMTKRIARRDDPFDLAATMLLVFGAPAWRGRDGHLRARVVHRQTAHARNRHPHGTRRVRPRWCGFSDEACGSARSAPRSGSVAALGVTRLSAACCSASARPIPSHSRARWLSCSAVSAVAPLVPAWRAARTDPLIALRHQ